MTTRNEADGLISEFQLERLAAQVARHPVLSGVRWSVQAALTGDWFEAGVLLRCAVRVARQKAGRRLDEVARLLFL